MPIKTLALLAALTRVAAVQGGDGPMPSAASLRLASGATAHYDYHFDRNALRDSRRRGNALIALTASGNLLRFDLATRKLTRERYNPAPAVCLGGGDGAEVLAGFSDGRVCRVNPETLGLVQVAKIAEAPRWIGGDPAKLVIAMIRSKEARRGEVMWVVPWTIVHDLASDKTYEIDQEATTFLLDARRRLWLGGDRGEFGGWCSCIDLPAGTMRPIAAIEKEKAKGGPRWNGIYGFTQLRDGQVWAHGGVSHVGFDQAYIHRVDRGKAEALFLADNTASRKAIWEKKPVPKPDRPRHPVTQIIEEESGEFVVVSYSDIFRADAKLAKWNRVQEIDIRYRWGRRDAMGSYPSVVAVHHLDGKGEFACATALDGYMLASGGKSTPLAIAGQWEAGNVSRIEATREGMIFLDPEEELPWRRRSGKWETADFRPPFEKDPEEREIEDPGKPPSWSETFILVGKAGEIFTLNDGGGARTTARWEGGKAKVLGRERSGRDLAPSFLTPDGKLWNTWDDTLSLFDEDKWTFRDMRLGGEELGKQNGKPEIGPDLRVIGQEGPPWMILDRDLGHLVRFTYGQADQVDRLDVLKVAEGDRVLKVADALPWAKGELLLATDAGLRLFETSTGRVRPAPLPAADASVKLLGRDGLGRLWLGGEGLWVLESGAKAFQPLAELPMMGRTAVSAISADPEHPDGIVASLGERGVVFVRVEKAK